MAGFLGLTVASIDSVTRPFGTILRSSWYENTNVWS